jgi:hypothetical protein
MYRNAVAALDLDEHAAAGWEALRAGDALLARPCWTNGGKVMASSAASWAAGSVSTAGTASATGRGTGTASVVDVCDAYVAGVCPIGCAGSSSTVIPKSVASPASPESYP